MKLRSMFLAGALAALALPAAAADLPSRKMGAIAPIVPASTNWAGLYFGVTGGYAFDSSPTMNLEAYQTGYGAGFAPYGWAQGATALLNNRGFVGGANAGYNWQFGSWVVGGETSIEAPVGGNTRTATFPTAALLAGVPTVAQIGAGWTTRFDGSAKIGLTLTPNLLLYVGGGPAFVKTSNSVFGGSAQALAAGYGTKGELFTGYHVKAGIDFMILPGWSAKLEYDHADFGSHTVSGAGLAYGSTPAGLSVLQSQFIGQKRITEETIRVGLTYHTNFLVGGNTGIFFNPTGNMINDISNLNGNASAVLANVKRSSTP